MAITVGSVEVDVVPNTRGIYNQLRAGLEPPATRAGEDAGRAAGRAFGPAMQASLAGVGERIGQQVGRQIASRVTAEVRGSLVQGVQQGGTAARASATRQGDEAGGAFGRTFRARVEAAVRALPDIQIGADTTEAEADIRALREQLATLSRQRVGIDVDAATARQQIDEIERELTRLGARHPDIAVRVNSGVAAAELATLRAELDRMDRDDVNVDVNTSTASANMNVLVASAIALGPALLPILPIAAAGLGAIAAAAVSAGVGLGVMAAVAAPAIAGVGRALQAQKAAQDAVSTSTGQGAQKALQMAGAQQALASAQRNAASQIASARDQVRQAARGVEDAEKQLADAQKASTQAQADLVQARKDAAQQLEDLASRYADAQLSVREAELSLAEAEQRRREVEKDPKSTTLEKQRAALAVDQATQRLREQTVETRRLAEEQTTAAKTGVEGTQVVKQAQDRLAKSQETVVDRTRGVADAQAAVTKAQENVARVSAQAADSIASAQRGIASASASAASGVSAAATAQAKYQAELAKLSPAARGTFDAFVALRSAFSAWSLSLQPAVMPIFTRALVGIKNSLPGLTPLVLAAADAVSGLQDRISKGFKSPWWQSFKDDLAASMPAAITGLGVAFGNIFKGIAGMLQAFMPHMDSIAERMEAITGRFARWGTTLKGSPAFERFLAYASAMGPVVASTFGDIGRALLDVAHALQPISGPLLKVLGALFQGVSWIATTLPGAIQLLYGIFIATRLWTGAVLLWQGAMWLASAAVTAFNFVVEAGPWGWIILAIVAVVAVVVLMYRKFDWFRAFIDGVWRGLVAGFQFLGQAASWLWENAIKPAFDAIWPAARNLATLLLTVLITPTYLGLKLLGAIAGWLWDVAIGPAFEGIATLAVWLWRYGLKPQIDLAVSAFKLLGETGVWLWTNALKPVFGWIADGAAWLWTNGIKPQFDSIRSGAGYVRDAFVWAKDGIKAAWDQLYEITRKPVQFVIDTVYNNGIRKVWNAVAKITGVGELAEYHFASGGILPGYTPGRDVHLAALSGGEAVMRPEWTRAVGAGYVDSMNSAARSGGVAGVQQALGLPGFADGGIFDRIASGVSTAGSWLSNGVDLLADPGKVWDKATGFIRDIAASISGSPWADVIAKVPGAMLGGLKDAIVKAAGSLGLGGGAAAPGGGVTRWSGVVQQALGLVGQPLSYTGTTLRRMEQESGGNPNIVNTWDSNWIAGYPSVGLMQVIRPTFQRYAGPFAGTGPFLYGVSTNPLANVYASMKYALAAYGSLPRAYDRAGGYDSGGFLQPGMNLAYNGTGRPEPVLTTAQWNALAGSGAKQAAADQRSYQITLNGSQMTEAEQAASLVRHMAFYG